MFVDSVVWIALKYKRDKYHEVAKEKFPLLIKTNPIHVTDFIILETYAFLLRKDTFETAKQTLNMFINSSKIKIVYNDTSSFHQSIPIAMKYENLSLVDANIVYHMELNNIQQLYSYDDGFDGVKSIYRLF